MNTRYKIALFVVCLVVLLAFQSKMVMPWAQQVAASDLFLEETKDPGSQKPVKTNMTRLAFAQCNNYITKELEGKASVIFPKEPINSWDVGNYDYMINADITVTPTGAASVKKRYACDIKYTSQEDMTGVSNEENWSVQGLSGLDGLL